MAWLAAWGLTPCANAARRILPISTALANMAMARNSLIGMVYSLGCLPIIKFFLLLMQAGEG
ncbi:hypothetical protein D3C72_1702230 [compost metagenome]